MQAISPTEMNWGRTPEYRASDLFNELLHLHFTPIRLSKASYCAMFFSAKQVSSDDNPESAIVEEIYANHEERVRPVAQPDDTLELQMGFSLNNIVGFDTDNYILTIHGWISMVSPGASFTTVV